MNSNSSNWLKAWLLPGAVMAMESTWLYLWMLAAALWHGSGPPTLLPYLLVAGTIACGFLTARWVFDQAFSETEKTALVVVLAILLAIVSVRVVYHGWQGLLSTSLPVTLVSYVRDLIEHPSMDLLAVVASGLLWWRGVRCIDAALSAEEVYSLFRVGLLGTGFALLVITSILVSRQDPVPTGSLLLPTIAFFLFGLVALSVARFAEIRRTAAAAGTGGTTSSRFWLLLLAGAAVIVVVPGIVLTGVVTPGSLQGFWYPFTLLWDGLSWLIIIFAYPIAFIGQILINLLRLILVNRPQDVQQDQGDQPNMEDLLKNPGHLLPPELLTAIKIVVIVAILVILVWVLVQLISRRRASHVEEAAVTEERESVFAWEILLAQLRDAWARFRQRILGYRPAIIGRREPTVEAAVAAGSGPLSVRQIYVALLRLVASLGTGRRADQTPYEYLTTLKTAFPGEGEELGELTEAYVRVRYGEETVTAPELTHLQSTWQKLQTEIQEEDQPSKQERK